MSYRFKTVDEKLMHVNGEFLPVCWSFCCSLHFVQVLNSGKLFGELERFACLHELTVVLVAVFSYEHYLHCLINVFDVRSYD